ncbi:hypothetical protein SDC9_167841 [bioreactor metagenome]|uniref:Uncharacterized protein n=1 Tax=bioreactor metagenome TaxID=1076179 RepID=A0A645G3E2_9ZZZZ
MLRRGKGGAAGIRQRTRSRLFTGLHDTARVQRYGLPPVGRKPADGNRVAVQRRHLSGRSGYVVLLGHLPGCYLICAAQNLHSRLLSPRGIGRYTRTCRLNTGTRAEKPRRKANRARFCGYSRAGPVHRRSGD